MAARSRRRSQPTPRRNQGGAGRTQNAGRGNAFKATQAAGKTATPKRPTRPRPGGGGTFTGPATDMGPTVHLPDHLMPNQPSTMFA